ncbi:hypothetical protein [Desulfomarina sp.]
MSGSKWLAGSNIGYVFIGIFTYIACCDLKNTYGIGYQDDTVSTVKIREKKRK